MKKIIMESSKFIASAKIIGRYVMVCYMQVRSFRDVDAVGENNIKRSTNL